MLDERDLQAIAQLIDSKLQESEQRTSQLIDSKLKESEQRTMGAIKESEQRTMGAIKESEQRTMGAIKDHAGRGGVDGVLLRAEVPAARRGHSELAGNADSERAV